ncbi:MAG TPA: cytochrome C oxidase subunit IV family protein [Candidatus Acidoferrum sp.]|nr:cytochrome C oxidase subunit IV family protein [Candidatus Acidoferrum sp.]
MSEQEHQENSEHIVPPTTYLAIILTLLVLTATTVGAAFINLHRFNIVVALAIATLKATLVVLFFMHAKYSPKRTKLIILAGIFWLALLLGMTLSDYITRVDYRGVRFPMTQVIQQLPAQRAWSARRSHPQESKSVHLKTTRARRPWHANLQRVLHPAPLIFIT